MNATSSVDDVVAWFERVLRDGAARRQIVSLAREDGLTGVRFCRLLRSCDDVERQFDVELPIYQRVAVRRALSSNNIDSIDK